MRFRSLLLAAAIALPSASAAAQPVQVSYTTSGSAGNWLLDFSVFNNIPLASQGLYFFGVFLGAVDVQGSPSGFQQWSGGAPWDNVTGILYDNNWFDGSFNGLPSGTTTNGFVARVTTAAAPTSVQWFAYSFSQTGEAYNAPDALYGGVNPGFEGVARTSSVPVPVPEPASLALLVAGMGALAISARSRRRSA